MPDCVLESLSFFSNPWELLACVHIFRIREWGEEGEKKWNIWACTRLWLWGKLHVKKEERGGIWCLCTLSLMSRLDDLWMASFQEQLSVGELSESWIQFNNNSCCLVLFLLTSRSGWAFGCGSCAEHASRRLCCVQDEFVLLRDRRASERARLTDDAQTRRD